jgi:hypothetical protein
MANTKEAAEPKLTLPAGHPQAGYVGPDLAPKEDMGVIPDEEQEYFDKLREDHEAEVKAVEEQEHKVATQEKADRDKALEDSRSEESGGTSATASTKAGSTSTSK